MLKKLQKHLWEDRINYLIILLGTFSWSLTMVKSGLEYDFGLGFWGPNGHDGVWHITLAQSLSEGSLNLPIFADAQVTNYHIGFDLFLALIHRLTTIPISILYFQIFPPLVAFTIGILLLIFLKGYNFTRNTNFWVLFFVYFGGNLGWLVTLIRNGEIAGSSMFWAQASAQTLINPPFSLSLCLILMGLISIQKNKYVLAGFIFGLLIQIKAYAAVVTLGALFTSAVFIYYKKRDIDLFKSFFVSVLISVVIFLPFNKDSGSLFVFKPFWFLETMMLFLDRVGWQRFGEAMTNYKLAGNWIKGVLAYAVAFFIFWYGNLGTRFITEIYVFRFKKNKPKSYEIFLLSAILIGLIIPMLFVQKGTAWNTIQFFYYSLFFSSILTGIVFAGILNSLKSKRYKLILILGMFFFTLPTSYDVLKHYLPATPPAMISNLELDALRFLSNQPDGVVLTPAFERELGLYQKAPRPLYLYESTSYVSAYTSKQVFIEDEINLDITGFDWQSRRDKVINFFENKNIDFLYLNNISYIYIPKAYNFRFDLKVIFENEEIIIYKVK